MNMTDTIDCRILAPDAAVFSGPALDLTVVDRSGQMQILPGHAEMFVALASGQIKVSRPDGSSASFPVKEGVLHFRDGRAVIVL